MTETLKSRPTIMPVKDSEVWMTSRFGWRKSPFTGLRNFHSGIDISGRRGAPIIATADGVINKRFYNYLQNQFDGLSFRLLYNPAQLKIL
jgi:murein DD-endopeptidase MepM/ murein hydrolase activator NlpD